MHLLLASLSMFHLAPPFKFNAYYFPAQWVKLILNPTQPPNSDAEQAKDFTLFAAIICDHIVKEEIYLNSRLAR